MASLSLPKGFQNGRGLLQNTPGPRVLFAILEHLESNVWSNYESKGATLHFL